MSGHAEPMRVAGLTGSGLVLADAQPGTARMLEGVYARYLAACYRRFLSLDARAAPAWRAEYAAAADVARRALGGNQRALLACFASPPVSTALHCCDLRDGMPAYAERIDVALRDAIPHLLLEMSLRGILPAEQSVMWPHGPARLRSTTLGGELLAPPGATGWRFSHSHVAAICGDVEVARLPARRDAMRNALADGGTGIGLAPFEPVGAVTHFVAADSNPIADFEEHPDKAGNHVDLGGRSAAEWVDVLDRAFDLIERFLPREFSEMALMLHQIIPVGFDDHRHLSASYREAIGTVYLTLHPNVMTMTEAVIHEFQHNKLNVASHGAEFLVNAFHPLYKSPVRPDPRPLWGIMLAVHAFLPVAELYRRMREAAHPLAAHPEFERRMSDIDLKNHEGMEMLRAHAEFTPVGRAMFDELESLERRHMDERLARGLETTPTSAHVG